MRRLIVGSGLTPEQEGYCRARAMGMGVQEAIDAADAGITHAAARTWERKQEIADRIQQLSSIMTRSAVLKTGLDREWVISRLMSVVERCMQAEPVFDKEGNPIGEYQFDSGGATRSLQLLGLQLGMFKPQETKPGDEYANLSEDDLARITRELATKIGFDPNPAGAEAQAGTQPSGAVQAVSEAN